MNRNVLRDRINMVKFVKFCYRDLMNVFNKTPQEALSLTLTIHKKNKAQIGIYPFDLAEAKQIECLQICEVHNFPIKITLEPV